jgi:hypothetical protein
MKKRQNNSTRASALQISVSVALLCVGAILFASSFRAAPPVAANGLPGSTEYTGFYPPLPKQDPLSAAVCLLSLIRDIRVIRGSKFSAWNFTHDAVINSGGV